MRGYLLTTELDFVEINQRHLGNLEHLKHP